MVTTYYINRSEEDLWNIAKKQVDGNFEEIEEAYDKLRKHKKPFSVRIKRRVI